MNPFKVIYNGLTIQDGTAFILSKLTPLFAVPIRTASAQNSGRDGGVIWNQLYDMRRITIEGMVVGGGSNPETDFFTQIRALTQAFRIPNPQQDLPLQVYLWDGSVKTIYCRPIDAPLIALQEEQTSYGSFQITLLCSDPFWNDSVVNTYSLTITTTGGFPIPAPIPFPLGGTINMVNIVNNGDIDTYATFTFTGNITNPTIVNTTTGENFSINTSLSGGDVVVVKKDNTGLQVTKNGSNILSSFDGTFFKIRKGSNILVMNASIFDSTSLCTVTFYNKYLSI
jgi:hypothetical protein